MFILFLLFGIYIFVKTVSYGLYEWKTQKNKPAAISIIVLASICLVSIPLSIYLIY